MSTFQDDQQQMKIDNHHIDQEAIFYEWLTKNRKFGYEICHPTYQKLLRGR